jgi:hypothetical protein
MKTLVVRLFLAATILGARPSHAQSTFGSIVGSVKDASDAAVTAAVVSVRDLDENLTRSTASNEQGLYQVLNLRPGRYEITATKPGFATVKVAEVQLQARQELRQDIQFQVAALTETVIVEGTATGVNTENATIADSKDFSQITHLPVNYRGSTTSPLSAILTVPGVQQDAAGNYSIGGGMPTMIEYSVDGVSTVSVRSNGPLADMYPSSEMLSEFKVTSINNNAEFSQMGDVTVSTKNGTNQAHGSAFWYHQNAALSATTYGATSKPAKVFNTFGGSLSGPVLIPHLYNGHNQTFFFVAYEGNRKPGSTLLQFNVPTAVINAGNLNGLPGGAAVDPSNGAPFPENLIPTTRINPVAKTFLSKYYPTPNYGTGDLNANFRELVQIPSSTNGYDIRIDHAITPRQQIYGRWSWKDIPYYSTNGLLPTSTRDILNKNLVVSYNDTFRSNLINEFRFGFSLWERTEVFPIKGADALSTLGITGLDVSKHADAGAFPGIDFSDGTGFSTVGRSKDSPTKSRSYQFTDNLSWVLGRHSLKFGADIRKLGYNDGLYFNGSDDFGNFTFQSGAFSGNAFADFLLGLPYSSSFAVTGPDLDERVSHFQIFGQDEWRVSGRLTLNVGLRWELHPPFSEASGNISNYDRTTGDVIIPDHALPPAPGFAGSINACPGSTTAFPCTKIVTASQAGFPANLRYTYYKNFDPRFSFAWRPFANNKTVLRGGFGVFTETTLGSLAYALTGIHTTDTRQFVNFQGRGQPPLWTLPQAFAGSYSLSQIGTQDFVVATDPTLPDPRSYQWTFSVDRELPRDTALRLSYVGSNSVGLVGEADLNQVHAGPAPYSDKLKPNPDWFRLETRDPINFAVYHALQVEARRHFSHGLFFQSSYVLAKNLGNGAGAAGGTSFQSEVGTFITDRFNTRLDRGNLSGTRRHRFLLSAIYGLPLGRGRTFGSHMNPVLNSILGGWELSTVSMIQSGTFLTPTTSRRLDQSNTNMNARGISVRPDRISDGNLPNPKPDRWFDITAFMNTPAGANRFGNAGPGILIGPGTIAVAAGMSKTFPIKERLRMRLEAAFTNLPNHPNFAVPGLTVSTPTTFGKVTSVQSAENSGNRNGQVSVRLDF